MLITIIFQFLVPTSILVKVFIAMKRHYDHENSYTEKCLIVVTCLQFRDLLNFSHDRKQEIFQADMLLKLSHYILIQRQQEVNCDNESSLSIGDLKAQSTVTHFFQQGHTQCHIS